MEKVILLLVLIVSSSNNVTGVPAAVGICYAGCAALVVACYSAAGFTFGTVILTEILTHPALSDCNRSFSKCESNCMKAYG